jgi:hypothetical protein
VVALHNFVEEQGRLYLVMQFAEGSTFEHLIHQFGVLTWKQASPVIVAVLRALEYAHNQNVVHRDIKPSNILVRSLDRALIDPSAVKVTDFGIAKITQGELRMTQTGQTMGTVSYMSPEQVRGEQADGRSDIYALGVTLYEALTGKLPFEGSSHYEVMTKHVSEKPVPPSNMGIEVHPKVEAILLRSMAKRANDRYVDAGEMRRELERFLNETAPEAGRGGSPSGSMAVVKAGVTTTRRVEARPASKNRLALLGGGAVALVGAGVAALLWARSGRPPAPVVAPPPAPAPAAAVAPVAAARPGLAAREHPLLKRLTWKTDQQFPGPGGRGGLRVLSLEATDVGPVRARFEGLRDRYVTFLKAEGVDAPLRPRSLTVALVTSQILDDPSYLPGASASSGFYSVADGTLFIQPELQDFAQFVAFHLCPVRVDRTKCLDFKERFAAQNSDGAGAPKPGKRR